MLQIKHIHKEYRTGNLVQKALDDVSLTLRDNEFVAILGPSGSGKTTLLNIIGGLDRYDSGDLIINEISTKNYRDKDWDSYRNHTIGFVFQSYNLIPHQTILSNVELALTISGISKGERREKAIHALKQVGLGEQLHKKPNQLSGGQMQRVAIARALVNDPDILLADEPTGALDSDTSVQVMDLLKEVAKDRLVVMVTHNPELAESYATRIVTLRDGKIRSDSNPCEPDERLLGEAEHRNMGKTSMSFLTSLSLSFNNLKTKKGRTILTAFAGSIGIIGIALILSLSNGVNNYIKSIEEETLSEYPLQIQSSGFDLGAMMPETGDTKSEEPKGDIQTVDMLTGMFATVGSNDLKSLKEFLDSGESDIKDYTNAIEYSYPVSPQIYSSDTKNVRQVHPDKTFGSLGIGSSTSANSMVSSMMSTDVFYSMPADSRLYEDQYDVKAGRWPQDYHECILVLTSDGNISDFLLYTLGLRDPEELEQMVNQFAKEEEVKMPEMDSSYDYEDILGTKFKLVSATDYYAYDGTYDVWKDKTDDSAYMKDLVAAGEDLEIVGIVQPKKGATAAMLTNGIYYTQDLVKHVIDQSADSEIVKAQLADSGKNVFTGKSFDETEESENGFDMNSLFTVDENKMQSAFKIDQSKLNLDLSGINDAMGSLSLPALDMNDIVGQLNLTVSQEQIQALTTSLMAGYQEYAKNHPEADYSRLDEHVIQYLNDPEVSKKLNDMIKDAVIENGDIVIYPEQMQKIMSEILAGYSDYAEENGYPDLDRFGENFAAYLGSDEAAAIIAGNLAGFVQSSNLEEQITAIINGYMQSAFGSLSTALERELTASIQQLASSMQNAFTFDTTVFADAFQTNMTEQDLAELMASMMSRETYTYENNLTKLGYAEAENPSLISIYPKDFEAKEQIVKILDDYNQEMEKTDEEKVINYTDLVGTMMSSVTTIINVISYVLIAFVAISLVVSSIMIGVITYISVLERKKEIGILRAIGASRKNVSQVFNAETFIIGALAGLIGIGITLLLLIPANQLIHHIAGNSNMNAALPPVGGVVLILLSILLTLIGGIIPSRKAAKEDPVTALRTE